ncbi:hypothetical protein K2X33_13400 [bacterium]|nr:hypothetical protein [bacterium]
MQQWVQARSGSPATVEGTGGAEPVGILRIRFPGYEGKTTLKEISWEDFFKKFEERRLAFLCQDKTAEGTLSKYWKLVRRADSPV